MKNNWLVIGGILLASGILIWYFRVDVGEILTGKGETQLLLFDKGTLKFISFAGICVGVGGIIAILKGLVSQK